MLFQLLKGGEIMKKTTRYLSLLLVLLLCGALIFTSCNVGETVEGKREEESSTIKLEYQDPTATEDVAAFMLEQAKIQFKGVPWGSTPAEIAEYMKTQDCLIEEGTSFIHGREQIEDFYENSQKGKPGFVKIVDHYIPSKITSIDKEWVHLQLIFFDGELYHTVTLNSNGEADTVETFPYLIHDVGHQDMLSFSRDYNHYLLSNDKTMTHDRIMRALVSSSSSTSFSPAEARSTFCFVCSEYTNYVEIEVP